MVSFSATLSAPCKVNLTLDVGFPRADGYHDIDSLVVLFTPADEVTVSCRTGTDTNLVELTCDDPALPTDSRNLAYRAATVFRDTFAAGETAHLLLHLRKRLPHQAGLGGGSSDAAGVLKAFAAAANISLSDERLRAAAASLGSDVPLFLQHCPVRMRGRGEVVEALPFSLPPLFGVLVKPDVGVPTGPAYARLDALRHRTPGASTPRLLELLRTDGANPEALGTAFHNDFEAAVLPAYPEVADAHRAVRDAGAVRALLCGSGAAVFGLARDRDHARALTKSLCGKFSWVHLAESVR